MKPKPAPEPSGPMLPVGTKVMVLRPNLWAGASGEVVKHKGDKHWVKVPALNGNGYFHGVATLSELKEIKP